MEKCESTESVISFAMGLSMILGLIVISALILPVFFEIGDTIKYVVARKLRKYYD